MNRITAALAAAILTAFALTGCIPVVDTSSPDPEPAVEETTEPDVVEPSFAPEPEPDPEPSGNLPFGDAAEYVDGLVVSVSAPAAFTPSQYAMVGSQPHNVQFNVTITNGTQANFDNYAYITATSGGASGEQIFDSQNGMNGPPSGVILPGQSITFPVAFNVADPNAIVLSVGPGFDYDEAIFTNTQ